MLVTVDPNRLPSSKHQAGDAVPIQRPATADRKRVARPADADDGLVSVCVEAVDRRDLHSQEPRHFLGDLHQDRLGGSFPRDHRRDPP